MEMLRNAMPYDNEIVTSTMTGEQLQRVIAFKGDVAYYTPIAIDPAKTYRVATTEYLAKVSAYKTFFGEVQKTGMYVRDELRKTLRDPCCRTTASPSP